MDNRANTSNFSDIIERGDANLGQGKYDKAISDYTLAIELDPGKMKGYYMRGYTYERLGKYIEAISDYTRAIELDPYNAYAYYTRGTVFKKQSRYVEAVSDFIRTIEIDPRYSFDDIESRGIVRNIIDNCVWRDNAISAKPLYLMINSGFLFYYLLYDFYAWICKANIVKYIVSLPEPEKLIAIQKAIFRKSRLNKYLHSQWGFYKPNLMAGCLKELLVEYIRIKKQKKDVAGLLKVAKALLTKDFPHSKDMTHDDERLCYDFCLDLILQSVSYHDLLDKALLLELLQYGSRDGKTIGDDIVKRRDASSLEKYLGLLMDCLQMGIDANQLYGLISGDDFLKDMLGNQDQSGNNDCFALFVALLVECNKRGVAAESICLLLNKKMPDRVGLFGSSESVTYLYKLCNRVKPETFALLSVVTAETVQALVPIYIPSREQIGRLAEGGGSTVSAAAADSVPSLEPNYIPWRQVGENQAERLPAVVLPSSGITPQRVHEVDGITETTKLYAELEALHPPTFFAREHVASQADKREGSFARVPALLR